MSEKKCSVDGCERKRYCRGWCRAHYQRWLRRGTTDPVDRKATAEEAFGTRVRPDGDCLVWTGSIGDTGYGTVWVDGVRKRVHRYAWELENGRIPDGMVVDHVCWNRACVNVAHLRLATPQQNAQNLQGGLGRTGVRGVSEETGGYQARVKHNGETFAKHFSGRTPESLARAGRWAKEKRRELFGEFAGGEGRE